MISPGVAHDSGTFVAYDELRSSALRQFSTAVEHDQWLLVSVPVPVVPAEALLLAAPEADAEFWQQPGGVTTSGIGTAAVVRGRGPQRFRQVITAANDVFARVVRADTSRANTSLRLFGGFAFGVGQADTPPWSEFGDARFVLPKYRYVASERGAQLEALVLGAELGTTTAIERAATELSQVASKLTRAAERIFDVPSRAAAPRLQALDEPRWVALVEELKRGIQSGQFEKVVLAQRAVLLSDAPADVARILVSLRAFAQECTRFALRAGGMSFVGATPERLVQKRGLELYTEAVAGSIRREGQKARRELLDSRKDRAEHDIVVRELLRQLTPIATSVSHRDEPEIRELTHLLHLCTPIHARLREPCHVLELVERLHPTPAVGGMPRQAAVEWLLEHEPNGRGWYAGPVGWFDAAGDGEFHVALRSGLITRDRAYVYAGAGVVEDSDPRREYSETLLKMRALSAALGDST